MNVCAVWKGETSDIKNVKLVLGRKTDLRGVEREKSQ